MLSTLRTFGDWLATTGLSETIQNVSWIIPTLQTVHIVSVAAVITAIFMIDLRILGVFAPSQSLAALYGRFSGWVWYALVVLLVTGTLLIIAEPGRSLTNPAFFAKMIMLAIVAGLTWVVQRPLRTDAGYWEGSDSRRLALKTIALASLVLWTLVVFAGRWIAYVTSL